MTSDEESHRLRQTPTNGPRAREPRSYQQRFLLEILMKASRFPLVGTVLTALIFSACSDVQNPAAPRSPSFTLSSSQSTNYSGRERSCRQQSSAGLRSLRSHWSTPGRYPHRGALKRDRKSVV